MTIPQSMLVATLHIVVGLIGAILLYAALFLHEAEEGKLQNRLEKLWVDIDDLSKAALSKQTAFLQQISAMASSGLNLVFGKRLVSLQAISVSITFSMGAALLFFVYRIEYRIEIERLSDISAPVAHGETVFEYAKLWYMALGIISLIVGFWSSRARYMAPLWILIVTVFMMFFDLGTGQFNWNVDWVNVEENALPVFLILGCSFLCDVFFVAVSRWCLKRGSELKNGWSIASLLTLNGCIGLILVSPLLWVVVKGLPGEDVQFPDAMLQIELVGATNLVTGMISFLFGFLALVAFAHLGVWPILKRPLYSLQRFGVARNPKLLAATSVTCLLFAWPQSPIIQAITKLIHG